MELLIQSNFEVSRLGAFPGTFNPPTVAHLAMARAALRHVDQVVWLLPRRLPHKSFEVTTLEERVGLLRALIAGKERFSLGLSEGGLFIEIARECKQAYGDNIEVFIICGRDAAERAVNWDYGRPGAFAEMLREFQMLVAPRNGPYRPPAEFASRIHPLEVPSEFEWVSATEVRRRIELGQSWEHLVPQEIVALVKAIYEPRLRQR